uniref:nucleopolyhedrovirus P10 family protein n=1 Tax=Streptomyces sp. ISBFB 2968 TaxID=2903527 RepID=UPI002FDBA15E
VAGVRPGDLRVGFADPDDVREPAVPLPPGALPPGPLRVTADFAVVVGPTTAVAEPLPATAARLRAALAEAAAARLGLTAADVDLRVTGLLDETPEAGPEAGPGPGPVDAADTDTVDGDGDGDGGSEASGDEGRVARAALTVPGVARLTGVLGRPVHLTEPPPQEGALPRRHVRVELAVRADHRAVEVARRVRAAVSEAVADRPTVAVVVTRTDVG